MKNGEIEAPQKMGLKNRHIQLIAIAGTIGTGLFLGAGKTIEMTGPSIVFSYIIVGIAMFVFLRTIGELLYKDPTQHSFLNFTTKYVGNRTGYFVQWTYWLVLVFVCISELTAIGTYVQFWLPNVPLWLIEIIALVLLFGLNTLNARFFGETEFWFAIIKVAAIVGMIGTAIFLLFGHFEYSSVIQGQTYEGSVSLSNITNNFSFFPKGIMNWVSALQMVMFAFTSMEFIGMTAAETENPRKTIPKAINQIPIRILIFYVGALLAIMTIFTWTHIPADKSPFVMVFQLIGIKWAAALINFVVLTSAGSALNSSLFSATRNMYSLAKQHDRGKLTALTKLSRNGIPLNALYLVGALSLFAPVLTLIPQIQNAFDFAASCTTNLFLIVYFIHLYTFYKYRQSSDFDPEGFLTPKAKITVPFVVVIFSIVFISLFFHTDTRFPALGALVWTVIFGIYSRFRKS
ncbi:MULTISPECIES: amino acid permease [unclassified Lactococcus]|uniref:amino acid permease n=1 Tax=unclassified Lactococcus TaxID=2643510 RepID=UPI0011CB9853|nr:MULTISPECIES: amino acid permease [unclassified Lactococcus]MQW23532.1 amino acid permease [Lactococcus sp. dk101]TXK37861.1 amino acid permease [Lactococcus sp. dk310]TXK49281.1 amino acid permease [Lactococcus sp. dk322]